MHLSPDTLLRSGAIQRSVKKGKVIFCEGEKAHFFYQIVTGRVKMVNTGATGKDFIQGLFGPGDSFGEPALFTQGAYPAAAVAEEDTVLLRLTYPGFLQLLINNPDMHFAFTRHLATRLLQRAVLQKESCCGQTATLIGTVLQRYKVHDGPMFRGRKRVHLTRQQIADMTGLRVETVIRVIRNMFKNGEVVLEKGKVYV